jgi:uncharacterized membrane-anchored protein YhcB (DUF1043 family)
MIHYWWLFVLGLIVGFLLGTLIVRKGTALALKHAEQLREENDRLHRRIEMIGNRALDGT